MKTALPGQRSIQETGFSPGIFAPIFSSTDSVGFRPSLPQNTNTASASGLLFPFQTGLQPGCQKGILQRDFWLAPVDPWFSSHAEDNDAVHASGPVAQDHQPWPSTPEALHVCGVLQDHTSPGMCLPCSGDNGGLLLPLLLPHLQSQHHPAIQVWGGREAVRQYHRGSALSSNLAACAE